MPLPYKLRDFHFQFPILGSTNCTNLSRELKKGSFNSLYWVQMYMTKGDEWADLIFQFPILGSQ